MGASDSEKALSLRHLQGVLSEWLKHRKPDAVRFVENTQPEEDPDSRYTVIYEAVFEPSTLDVCRVELWFTTDGEIALGLETRSRIASRLGVKTRQYGFATGHEPRQITQEGLMALLGLVANGEVAIATTTFPIWGLYKAKAFVHPNSFNILSSKGYDCDWWLGISNEFHAWDLCFKPW